jgi:hypothetical protein
MRGKTDMGKLGVAAQAGRQAGNDACVRQQGSNGGARWEHLLRW